MPEFTITLINYAIINGTIKVEAESLEDAKKLAVENASQASWPVDDCGDVLQPQGGAIAVNYARNEDTGEELFPDADCLPAKYAAADEVLTALKNMLEVYGGHAEHEVPAEDQARTAIARAEGRADG